MTKATSQQKNKQYNEKYQSYCTYPILPVPITFILSINFILVKKTFSADWWIMESAMKLFKRSSFGLLIVNSRNEVKRYEHLETILLSRTTIATHMSNRTLIEYFSINIFCQSRTMNSRGIVMNIMFLFRY